MAKLDHFPPRRFGPGVEVRIIHRVLAEKDAPSAESPFVTAIVVDDDATSYGLRRAVPAAIAYRNDLRLSQGHNSLRRRRAAGDAIVRVVHRTWVEEDTPLAKGVFVTVIVVDENTASNGVRRAIPHALARRNELVAAQGYHGAHGLLEGLLNDLHFHRRRHSRSPNRADIQEMKDLGVPAVTYGTWGGLADYLSALLEGLAKQEAQGDEVARWWLNEWLVALFPAGQVEVEHRRLLRFAEAGRSVSKVRAWLATSHRRSSVPAKTAKLVNEVGKPVEVVSATQVRNAVRRWQRSKWRQLEQAMVKRTIDRFAADAVRARPGQG